MKKLIFRKIYLDISGFFLAAILIVGLIVWTIQAVNYFDFVTEDGHGLKIYFYYSLLNFPKIIQRIFPFIFFFSVFYIISSYEFKNEIFLACDPFLTGSIKLLGKIKEMNIKNIYISDLDFSSLHQKIKNFTFKTIFILFPDPWHKRRHFKRKLINQSFIKKIKLICDNNTSVVIATDNMIYQDIIRESFKKDKHFEKLVEKILLDASVNR